MITIQNGQVTSDIDGAKLQRVNNPAGATFTAAIILPGETADDFIEITPEEQATEAAAPYTHDEYRREVERLIALRYTTGQELQFCREREAAGSAYTDYLAYIADCKRRAIANLTPPAEEDESDGSDGSDGSDKVE